MKQITKKVLASLLVLAMLAAFMPFAFAADEEPETPANFVSVNGDVFDGSLASAINAAGPGGVVGIHGHIETLPLSIDTFEAPAVIDNVTIQGETENAEIVLHPLYFDLNGTGLDILPITGANVTIRNLTLDAIYKVDYALRIYSGASNITIENVVARRGIIACVGVFSDENVSLVNTKANDSLQSGFYFDALPNGAGVSLTDCTTTGNARGGILVRNAYGPVLGLDLSGISCTEGIFCIEDMLAGTLAGEPRADIHLVGAPKNGAGVVINTDIALFFRIDAQYQHIRYGISDNDVLDARASITTDRYGFNTKTSYKSLAEANGDLREGESIEELSVLMMLINRIKKFIEIIRNAIGFF